MSVHQLKRLSGASANSDGPVSSGLSTALERLRHWAQVAPLRIALRHKRNGAWYQWRWIDVLRDVERLADGLRQQGFAADSRLALSGGFEPNLLLLALAAMSVGGTWSTVSRDADVDQLRKHLHQDQPSHAFVQTRQQLLLWLKSIDEQGVPGILISNQIPPRIFESSVSSQVLNFPQLLGDNEGPQSQVHWWSKPVAPQLWSEEGTEWPGGLVVVLEQWLERGQALAFPENRGSASRDRRDITPSGLLLSSARLQVLAEEIDNRLAAPGTWRRQLCDWAIASPQKGLRRWMKNRVRYLLGFQHLQYIWQAPILPGSARLAHTAHMWVIEPDRKSA
jgi:hypothetical protein